MLSIVTKIHKFQLQQDDGKSLEATASKVSIVSTEQLTIIFSLKYFCLAIFYSAILFFSV